MGKEWKTTKKKWLIDCQPLFSALPENSGILLFTGVYFQRNIQRAEPEYSGQHKHNSDQSPPAFEEPPQNDNYQKATEDSEPTVARTYIAFHTSIFLKLNNRMQVRFIVAVYLLPYRNNAGKLLSFKIFQKGASCGGNIGNSVGKSELVDTSD